MNSQNKPITKLLNYKLIESLGPVIIVNTCIVHDSGIYLLSIQVIKCMIKLLSLLG